MKTHNLDFDDGFLAQCALNKFWNSDIVELQTNKFSDSDKKLVKKLANVVDRDSTFGYGISCKFLDRKILIHSRLYPWDDVSIVKHICHESENLLLKFVKKMNQKPITVYKHTMIIMRLGISQIFSNIMIFKQNFGQ